MPVQVAAPGQPWHTAGPFSVSGACITGMALSNIRPRLDEALSSLAQWEVSLLTAGLEQDIQGPSHPQPFCDL